MKRDLLYKALMTLGSLGAGTWWIVAGWYATQPNEDGMASFAFGSGFVWLIVFTGISVVWTPDQ